MHVIIHCHQQRHLAGLCAYTMIFQKSQSGPPKPKLLNFPVRIFDLMVRICLKINESVYVNAVLLSWRQGSVFSNGLSVGNKNKY